MSRSNNLFVGQFRANIAAIGINTGVNPVVVWNSRAVGVGAVLGSRLHSLYASTNAAGAKTLNLARGHLMVAQETTATGAMAIAGGNTITRATGSFVTDGFDVGQRILIENPTSAGNRVFARITAVSATVLTFAAAAFPTNEALPTGARIHLIGQAGAVSVPASAGQSASVAGVNLLTNTILPWLANKPDASMVFGQYGILVAWVSVAMGSGETMDIVAEGGDHEA